MTSARWLAWCCCAALVACGKADSERALSFDVLTNGAVLDEPLQLAEFAPVGTPMSATNTFSGRLRLHTDEQSNQFDLLLDEFDLITPSRPGVDELPRFDIQLVQDGDYLVPMVQGPVINEHGWWEFVLRPGRVWDEEGDNGFTRAAMPFALKEIREDCIHNGLMSFLFNDEGQVSQVAFQISNQTCRYLQFEMRGLLSASYEHGAVDDAESVVSNVRDNRLGRIPQKSIEFLAQDYEGASTAEFGSHEEIDPADMTAYGFVIDGTHYVGGCETPYGIYPYCDEMALPSYSTAKSVVGGLGLMLMEANYPGTADALIEDHVPECAEDWQGVTIEHALDMTTGHFRSSNMHTDEDAAANSRFFNGDDHATKIDYACNEYPRQSDPGEHLVYHTWDTYLAGTALNNRLKVLAGSGVDFYTDLLVEQIWKPLGLSVVSQATRRTYDDVAQPFTGFGLTFVRDDVARLAQFIGEQDGRLNGEEILDRALFDAIKQRVPDDPGLVAELEAMRYNNGFRSFDVSGYLGCDEPAWVVVLSGFGGIIVAIMPNDTAYYYFSDGNVHRYLHAVRESHKIRPMCL
jgi:hypothetical protein